MRVLVVGAGAVGQVYAFHFWKGGAQVGFLVREKYAQDLRDKALVLHALSQFGQTKPVLFREYEVVSRLADIKQGAGWDVVVCTISSAALREGSWLGDFLASLGPNTTLVNLGSGLEDREQYLKAGFPRSRLVEGFITFSSWQAPLPGEKTHPVGPIPWPEKDINKPLGYLKSSPLPFTGDPLRVTPITSSLTQGGLWAVRVPGWYDALFALPAVATPVLVALEAEGWSFRALSQSPLVPLATRAIGDCLKVTGKSTGIWWVPLMHLFIWTIGIRFFLLLLLWVMPFDFEAFTRYHFQKVGAQTKLYCDDYIREGRQAGLPMRDLERLTKRNPRWQGLKE